MKAKKKEKEEQKAGNVCKESGCHKFNLCDGDVEQETDEYMMVTFTCEVCGSRIVMDGNWEEVEEGDEV